MLIKSGVEYFFLKLFVEINGTYYYMIYCSINKKLFQIQKIYDLYQIIRSFYLKEKS